MVRSAIIAIDFVQKILETQFEVTQGEQSHEMISMSAGCLTAVPLMLIDKLVQKVICFVKHMRSISEIIRGNCRWSDTTMYYFLFIQ